MKQDSLAPSLKHRLWRGESPPTTSMIPEFLWSDNNVCLLLCPPGLPSNTHTCQGSRPPATSGLPWSFSAFSFRAPFSVHVFCCILSPSNYIKSVMPVSSEVTVKNLVQPGRRVFGQDDILWFLFSKVPALKLRIFLVRIYSTSQSIIDGNKGRNLEAVTEREAMGECCFLASSSWLTHLLSYTTQDTCLGMASPP